MLFVLLQRYTFWSNSQRWIKIITNSSSCLYYCKDTLFEAIHNRQWVAIRRKEVVCITAKIHFLKQFTTNRVLRCLASLLFVLLQRYTFWSNSQPLRDNLVLAKGCLYYCKDTLFEAIHNVQTPSKRAMYVVFITPKIPFLKKFTTS